MQDVKTVGVIGAGQMGNGIAHVFALSGREVGLYDLKPEAIQAALAVIDRNLERQLRKGSISEADKAAALARIRPVSALSELGAMDLVIEAASEVEAVKNRIFEELRPHVKENAILASNTSSISITRLGAVSGHPERFMGVHFMNPPPVMKLVELIRGIGTDEAVFNQIRDLIVSIGKVPALAEDFPAFIVNRLLIPMINEAVYTLYERVGGVESIDTAMKFGANHPMGPLELADFIGLDTCLAIMNVLYEGLSDSKYRPCPLLVKYVEAGWLGRKAGRGFYDYRGEKPVPTR
ncbi:3-hydroxybutyryl-CoA dehydrogenase [Neomegalonema perideroedes]|uniref:3-hydroxybutyryl-CoA dehydrogenase n=1 Tax=Neomegalonema perideroedes TaxID=217219 RepID=UPI0003630913|nr:3-hydroxybutyryl-CoA dehydrogenase [Neomegalonema perideroedes]